jgi:flagellar P-ring protein FlgI
MKRVFFCLFISLAFPASAARIKDLALLRGARENQLMGYGIVVGLPGTGDRASDYTENSLAMLIRGLGIDLKSQKIETKNTAAVLVTATLPAFAKLGEHLDVQVASIGSASSLDGGTLMVTAMKGADGKVYAIAQGRIIMARRAERGGTPTILPMVAAEIPGGALLEKEVTFDLGSSHELHYTLMHPDFTTAARMAIRINEELSGNFATALDAGEVNIKVPYDIQGGGAVNLIARIEGLEIEPDRAAKIVINRRNGSIVLGENVRISPVSIAFNNLRIQVRGELPESTQGVIPDGENPPVPASGINQSKTPKRLQISSKGPSVADIVTSLNEVGAGPEDLVFLIQGLKSAGALNAEIELE